MDKDIQQFVLFLIAELKGEQDAEDKDLETFAYSLISQYCGYDEDYKKEKLLRLVNLR